MNILRLPATLILLAFMTCAAMGCSEQKNRAVGEEHHPTLAQLIGNPTLKPDAYPFLRAMEEAVTGYRKLIILFADERKQSTEDRSHADRVGQIIYRENRVRSDEIDKALAAVASSGDSSRIAVLEELVNWIEVAPALYDADRLAFCETLKTVQRLIAADQTLPSIKLYKRIGEDLEALREIEALYDAELKHIFSRFAERGIEVTRQKWEDYLAKIGTALNRDQILKDYGSIVPDPLARAQAGEERELTGRELPAKTLLLTFDDGPHHTYTQEIADILEQHRVPGVFFELGSNLGAIDKEGKPTPGRLSAISKKIQKQGHILANHSFSHPQMSKLPPEILKAEVETTEKLLRAVEARPSNLFRFPYGDRTKESTGVIESLNLRSVMWNIDSRDWADPIPNSIAERVLATTDEVQRGIILFHDINERTVKALPSILEKLKDEGYRFAGWDGTNYSVGQTLIASESIPPSPDYRESLAVVIGIDDYQKWPKLQYAVKDAEAVRELLISKLGFRSDRILTLYNGEATRANILARLNSLPATEIKKDDRIFVFFAGHGTTRTLSSGRNLGYIIPADSDPADPASTAIPMTELQNIAENLPAKHVFFVMDSCYSGLGLMRGGPPSNFFRDNAKRVARQMLTAGGADQMVADGGPGGHSIFTWTLLQGLSGKADLNGDRFITATELAAYLAPAVSSVSTQTPAFGSLPGSEGGEFIFVLAEEKEFITPETEQLDKSATDLTAKIDASTLSHKVEKSGKTNASAPAQASVPVKTLEGGETRLTTGKAVALTPRQAAQRSAELGLIRYREKRYPEAEEEFTKALKLYPEFALAANNLGFVYYKRKKYAEAARWFENAAKMDPSRAIAYYNLGDALIELKEMDKAKVAFRTYLELSPDSANAPRVREILARI